MKQKLILIFCVLGILNLGFSQAIVRQSINSYGGSSQIKESIVIEQSVGQPHQTETEDGVDNVRPGFIQSRTFNVESDSESNTLAGKVYPNPAIESFTLQLEENVNAATIRISNTMGSLIEEMDLKDFRSHNFNSSNWDNGTYLISLVSANGKVFKSRLIISK